MSDMHLLVLDLDRSIHILIVDLELALPNSCSLLLDLACRNWLQLLILSNFLNTLDLFRCRLACFKYECLLNFLRVLFVRDVSELRSSLVIFPCSHLREGRLSDCLLTLVCT